MSKSKNTDASAPFDIRAAGNVSRRLANAIFLSLPELRQHATSVKSGESDGLSLVLSVPSSTKDPARQLVIWVDEIGTPSIGFGPSHTHEAKDQPGIDAIIDIAKSILRDRLLIIEDVGGKHPGHGDWIDVEEPNALEEALTSPYSPGRAMLKSWSGDADREISIESLSR